MNEVIVCYACGFSLGRVLGQEQEDKFGFGPYADLSLPCRIRLYFKKDRIVLDKISLVCPNCGKSTFISDENLPKGLAQKMVQMGRRRQERRRESPRACARCGTEVPRGNRCPNCGSAIQFYT